MSFEKQIRDAIEDFNCATNKLQRSEEAENEITSRTFLTRNYHNG